MANVLATTKDAQAQSEKNEFEANILPQSMTKIENIIKKTKYFVPENHSVFIAGLLNEIVLESQKYGYRLRRIGQSEKYPMMNQLEFVKEK